MRKAKRDAAKAVVGSKAFHPLSEYFPEMISEEFDALVEDIRKNGLRQPIILFEGQVLEGRHRHRACLKAGVEPVFVEIDFPSADDAKDYLNSLNLYRRHLSTKQKRERIAVLLKANPETSDRGIAKKAGSNRTTVGEVREELEKAGDVSKIDTSVDSKGRRQPRRRRRAASHAVEPAVAGAHDAHDAGKNAAPPAAGPQAVKPAGVTGTSRECAVSPEPAAGTTRVSRKTEPELDDDPDGTGKRRLENTIIGLRAELADALRELELMRSHAGSLVEAITTAHRYLVEDQHWARLDERQQECCGGERARPGRRNGEAGRRQHSGFPAASADADVELKAAGADGRPDRQMKVETNMKDVFLDHGERCVGDDTKPGVRGALKEIRKAAGKIDPETAEVDWFYENFLDPYDFFAIDDRTDVVLFARAPGSDIWVALDDLPAAVSAALERQNPLVREYIKRAEKLNAQWRAEEELERARRLLDPDAEPSELREVDAF